jgi:hypothetical protein
MSEAQISGVGKGAGDVSEWRYGTSGRLYSDTRAEWSERSDYLLRSVPLRSRIPFSSVLRSRIPFSSVLRSRIPFSSIY